MGALTFLTLEAAHQNSVRQAISVFRVFPFVWPVALLLVGPGALVLGGAGALVIQFTSARVRSTRLLILEVAALGLLLGASVPLTVLWGPRNDKFTTGLMPLGGAIGLVCATAVFWLLRRMGLLRLSHDSEAV